MTKSDLVEFASSLDQLKIDIKNWEHEFKNRCGRQPDKQDIKQNPDIAAKYKEYHKAKRATAGSKENIEERERHSHRDHNQGRAHPHPSHNEREGSLLPVHESYHTPKRVKHKQQHHVSSTPTKSVPKVECDSPYIGNLVRQQSITMIGPTPQAEGRVLGIFDITNSPDYLSQSQQPQMILSAASPSPASTPKKTSSLTTPSKSNTRRTPQSVTPSYFRPLNMNKIYMTPSPLKPKKVSRGLTAILAELRQMQDEQLDEQESIMREMEVVMPEIKHAKIHTEVSLEGAENVVGLEDVGYHLGEIKEGDAVTILKESKEREATMEKAKYKKSKTQKRTTRRVLLRPAKPMAEITGKQELTEETSSSADDYEGLGGSDREVDNGAKNAGEQDSDVAIRKRGSTRRAGGISQNFKRLKMRNKNGKRFSRRQR
ncbi:DNA replication/checkpoint protein [Lipomyces doorenjongii]|uniref:DNA replication/checkpoint protein n=1 Tax=Lipomyces doorenjongii TaxID=383834 RepID=UPI0034CECA91